MTWLAYSHRFTPKRLAVVTQPSGATAGAAFTTQPVVRVLDGGGEFCAAATNTVIATKHTGVTGTLSGDTDKDAVAGVATFTDLAMSAGESGVSLDFASSGLTGTTSSTFNVGSTAGTITQFDNSSEVATDSDVLWADDFSTPCAAGSPGSWCELSFDDAGPAYGGPLTASAVPHTRGFGGTIFNRQPYPFLVRAITGRGTPYAASHGDMNGGQGADWMGDHNFPSGVTEFYTRFDAYFPSDYVFGAEKIWDINPPDWVGGGGIFWGNLHINLGGSASTTGTLYWQGTAGPSYSTGFTFQRGHWYSVQLYCKMSSPIGTGNGILKVWADDLGTDGTAITSGTAPTLRLNRTDYPFAPATGSHTQFGSIWCESWANPGSDGEWLFTNIVVRGTNGGSNGNSPIPIR